MRHVHNMRRMRSLRAPDELCVVYTKKLVLNTFISTTLVGNLGGRKSGTVGNLGWSEKWNGRKSG